MVTSSTQWSVRLHTPIDQSSFRCTFSYFIHSLQYSLQNPLTNVGTFLPTYTVVFDHHKSQCVCMYIMYASFVRTYNKRFVPVVSDTRGVPSVLLIELFGAQIKTIVLFALS